MIAAEQYASRLVVPQSQRSHPSSWASHKDHAAKALKKLAGPHLPGSLRQLETAVKRAHEDAARAERAAAEDPAAGSVGRHGGPGRRRSAEDDAATEADVETSDDEDRRARGGLNHGPAPGGRREPIARVPECGVAPVPMVAALAGCGGSGIGPASGGGPSHPWRCLMAKKRPVLTESNASSAAPSSASWWSPRSSSCAPATAGAPTWPPERGFAATAPATSC